MRNQDEELDNAVVFVLFAAVICVDNQPFAGDAFNFVLDAPMQHGDNLVKAFSALALRVQEVKLLLCACTVETKYFHGDQREKIPLRQIVSRIQKR